MCHVEKQVTSKIIISNKGSLRIICFFKIDQIENRLNLKSINSKICHDNPQFEEGSLRIKQSSPLYPAIFFIDRFRSDQYIEVTNFEVTLYRIYFKKGPFDVTPYFAVIVTRQDFDILIFTYALAEQAPNFREYNFFQPNESHPRTQ